MGISLSQLIMIGASSKLIAKIHIHYGIKRRNRYGC